MSSSDAEAPGASKFDFLMRAKPQIEVILGGVAGVISGAFGIAALIGEYRRLHPPERKKAAARPPSPPQAEKTNGARVIERRHVPFTAVHNRADTR